MAADNLPRASGDGPAFVRGTSWNALVDEVDRQRGWTVAGGSRPMASFETAAGRAYVDLGAAETCLRITGGGAGGKYAWEEVTRHGGAWVTTGRTGTAGADYALELNEVTDVPAGTVVKALRCATSGEWIFAREC